MANNRKIGAVKRAIENWVSQNSFLWVEYGNWYVGITNNPESRKSNHKNNSTFGITKWKAWNVGKMRDAHIVEKFFGVAGKGMKGGQVLGSANSKSVYVYVYKR